MKILENRLLAWILLAACVLVSIFGMGGGSLARQRAKAVEVFTEGAADRDSAHCMQAYLDRAFECASVMANEALLRLEGGSEDAETILEIIAALDMQQDDGFHAASSAYKQIAYQAADYLYNDMYRAGLSDAELVEFKLAYDDFKGCGRFIEKDPYIEMAEEFNKKRSAGFISELVCTVRGVDRLADQF